MKIKKIIVRSLTLYLPMLVFLLCILFPFYWFLVTSFKTESSIMKKPMQYLPIPFTTENYTNMFASMGFSTFFLNSLIVSVSTTMVVIVVAIFGGYALSRYKFRGKSATFGAMLVTQMLPGVVILIPLFRIFNSLHLINSLFSLTITYTATNLPFCIIMISGFFSSIPNTLEEAAQIDGCSLPKAIIRIVIPAIMPGVVATGAYAFVNAWNEFIYALNFINDSKKFTVPVGLSMMQGEFTVSYGGLAAGTIVALIPVLLLFCYIQKYLVQGLSAGAVKG